ncbi:MAG: type I restriction enzyme HsdR N-terminal domain-containing protein [Nitrospirota bacterium]|nr:type I restriction enzyme HsdR N-terminal domain-containing protein [Nitrospirota bacterium]MDH5769047.1 type I restriction enzyme HsdR N-terminal domain-containing protein [Nitrospirota bacterium]
MSEIHDFITGQAFLDTDDERIKQKIERLLIEEKGYSKQDIEVDKEFEIVIGKEIYKSKVDLIVNVEEKRFMIMRCARGSLVSREREVISCARILDVYQIPFAVVTNGEDAEVLDTISGEVIGNGLGAIPSKANALEAIKQIEFKKLQEKRIEKEKRIFLAFDAIKCPSKCD